MINVGNFTLKTWKNTPEYGRELEEARSRIRDLNAALERDGKAFRYNPDVTDVDRDGYVQFQLDRVGEEVPEPAGRDKTLSYVLKNGIPGFWTLSDLERFTNNWGRILEVGMFDLGYKRGGAAGVSWRKAQTTDRRPETTARKQIETVNGRELERLQDLWGERNSSGGGTYVLQVGERGMIYADFQGQYAVEVEGDENGLGNKGHIAREQDGFIMDARNIRIGEQEAIHITSVRKDNISAKVERVWPTQTHILKLHPLAYELDHAVRLLGTGRS